MPFCFVVLVVRGRDNNHLKMRNGFNKTCYYIAFWYNFYVFPPSGTHLFCTHLGHLQNLDARFIGRAQTLSSCLKLGVQLVGGDGIFIGLCRRGKLLQGVLARQSTRHGQQQIRILEEGSATAQQHLSTVLVACTGAGRTVVVDSAV